MGTKDSADRVGTPIKAAKHVLALLHSNKTQALRLEVVEGFKNGRHEVMIDTDIAPRGIDVAGVSHVVVKMCLNTRKITCKGSTEQGRAQNVGEAFRIFTAEHLDEVAVIEFFIGQSARW